MYKRPNNYTAIQWKDVTDRRRYVEHFVVWMTPAEDSTFVKLWGRIEEDLDAGNYTWLVENSRE